MTQPGSLFLFAVMLSSTACRETSVRVTNKSPEAEIVSPADGAAVQEGYVVELVGVASDPDDLSADLLASWMVEGVEVCPPEAPGDDGTTTCESRFTAEGNGEVVLVVQDPSDSTTTTRIHVVVNPTDPPVVRIVNPMEDGKYYSDRLILFEGVVTDTEDSPDALTLAWSSSRGDDLTGVEVVPDASGTINGSSYLTEGEHVLTLSATDLAEKRTEETVLIVVGPENTPPACALILPEDGSAGELGEVVTFEGTASDVDVAPDLLTVTWESDKDGPIGTSTANSDGTIRFPYGDLTVDTHVVTMTVADEVGDTCSADVIYTVGTAPTIALESPVDGFTHRYGDSLTFAATVTDSEDAFTDLTLSWFSSLDGEFSTQGSDSTGFVTFATSSLSAGSHSITATVTDTAGLFAVSLVNIEVNTAPTTPVVRLEPDSPTTVSDLTAVLDPPATDADGDPISYTWTWSVDGEVSPASTTEILGASATAKGQVWSVSVIPSDGTFTGGEATATTTILNTPPMLVGVELSPPSPSTLEALTCAPGASSDADGDDVTYQYRWTLDGVEAGVFSDTLESERTERGDVVVCYVTPDDGDTLGDEVVSLPVTVQNTAPSVASVMVMPADARTGDDLTCIASGMADDDADEVVLSYAWTVNGVAAGDDASVLAADAHAKGDEVRCTVTPTDGTDEGDALTSDAVTVQNTAPSVASVSISPGAPTVTDTLTCSYEGFADADDDEDASTYTWWIGSVELGAGPELAAGSFSADDTVRCVVTPFDGEDEGTPRSASVGVANAAPSVASVTVTPDPAYVTDTLSCSYTGFEDADGDGDASTVAWLVDGRAIGAGPTLTSGFMKGDEVVCEVTPFDGRTTGTPVTDQVTILNTLATPPMVSIDPEDPTTTDALVAVIAEESVDADGDVVSYTFMWYRDALVAPAAVGGRVESTSTAKGETWRLMAVPFDGEASGLSAEATVTIGNTAPSAPSISLSPSPARTTDTLLVMIDSPSTDVDGDAVEYRYSWTVINVDASLTRRGEEWVVTVTANDGELESPPISRSVMIENIAPTLAGVTLTPSPATAEDVLLCEAIDPYDADGDGISLSYGWQIGSFVLDETGSTLAAPTFARGDTVRCTVTPNDGTTDGSPYTSPAVSINNALPITLSVTLTPDPAYDTDILVCEGLADDADGDSMSWTYDWYVSGDRIGGSSPSLSGGSFAKHDEVYCSGTPNDGYGPGDRVDSNVVTISNSLPSITSVMITPSEPEVVDTLSCTWSGFRDTDGDSDFSTVEWLVGDAVVGTDTTLSEGFGVGDLVSCRVTPRDDEAPGDPVTSDPVTIGPAGGADVPGFGLCAGGGLATDGTYTVVTCTGPVATAGPVASDGDLTWQPGPTVHLSP
jgi:hypothetical protein